MFFRSLRHLARKATKSSHADANRGIPKGKKAKLGLETLENRITPSGVSLIKDINELGIWSGTAVEMNGLFYFNNLDPVAGNELCVSDGFTISLVADINVGPAGAQIEQLVNLNDTLFFFANDGVNGLELWTSDGTAGGTAMVQDFVPGAPGVLPWFINYFYDGMQGAGNFVYFIQDVSGVPTLVSSDGSSMTTVGTANEFFYQPIPYNGELYYNDNYGGGYGLYKSDGATLIPVDSSMGDFWDPGVVNGSLFFTGADLGFVNYELWVYDPVNGATQVAETNPGGDGVFFGFGFRPVDVNGTAYFAGTDGTNGLELWRSDGASTTLVQDITPGDADGDTFPDDTVPQNLTVGTVGGVDTLYFQGMDSNQFSGFTYISELYTVNQTGTTITPIGDGVIEFGNGFTVLDPTWFMTADNNGNVIFAAFDPLFGDIEPWAANDTTLTFLADISLAGSSFPYTFTPVGPVTFFVAFDDVNDGLYLTDGSLTGFVDYIQTGNFSSFPDDFTEYNGTMFFQAFDGVDPGSTLWTTDGTTGGTTEFLGAAGLFNVDNLMVVSLSAVNGGNPVLVFTATDGGAFVGNELFVYDGVAVGVIDINPGPGDSSPYQLTYATGTIMGNGLYFGADMGFGSGFELTFIDDSGLGAIAGVTDPFNISAAPTPAAGIFGGFTVVGCAATDNITGFGQELFVTIGGGVVDQFVDLNAGDDDENSGAGDGFADGSFPYEFTSFGTDFTYFGATGGFNAAIPSEFGTEPMWIDWITGSIFFVDVNTGDDDGGVPDGFSDSSNPYQFTEANGLMWMGASPGNGGTYLWATDAISFFNFVDLNGDGGIISYFPTNLTEFNGSLFFDAFADDTNGPNILGVNGNELWFATNDTTFGLVDPNMSPGANNSFFANLTVSNNIMYFWATADAGTGLWTYDPSSSPLPTFEGGPLGDAYGFTTLLDGSVVFAGADPNLGYELFGIAAVIAPIADAGGAYNTSEGNGVMLDASGTTDPDNLNSELTFSWDINGDNIFGDAFGEIVNLTWAQLEALFIDGQPIPYTVSVQVTDPDLNVSTASTTLTVANVAPTATVTNSGPVNEGSPVTVTFGNQFDPSTADTTFGFFYSYDFNGDGDYIDLGDILNSSNPAASFNFTENGSYLVNVIISDQNGGATQYSTTVTVNNVDPQAQVSNTGPVDEGGTANVSFSNQQDPGVQDTAAGFRYAYDFDNDNSFEVGDGTYLGSSTSATAIVPAGFLDDGNQSIVVHMRIIDDDGGFTDLFTTITVNNIDPTAVPNNNGPVDEGTLTASLFFTGAFDPSAADNAAGFRYAYDFNNDGVPELGSLNYGTASTSAAAAIPASFVSDGAQVKTMRMWILDKDNGITEYSTNVTVNNVAPTAVVVNDGPKPEGVAVTVSFTNPVDPSPDDFANLRYSYDWNNDNDFTDPGEFQNITLASQSHVFNSNGPVIVHVQISDNDGGVTDYTTNITITNSDIVVIAKDIKTLDSTIIVRDAETNLDKFPAFQAFGAGYKTGVRVAVGDVNGDGVPDIIAAPTKINALLSPGIRVFSGVNGAPLPGVLGTGFNPFASIFYTKGFFVAAADFNNDGKEDIVVGQEKKGSTIKVISGADGTTQLGADIVGFPLTYKKGVRVATGDVTGDGKADIIATSGAGIKLGKEALVKVFDGVNFLPMPGILGAGLNPFAGLTTFKSTLFVAGGDVNGDGRADLILASAKTQTEVRIISGLDGSQLGSFSGVADPLYKGGLRVATTDADGDGKADIIIGTGKAKGKAAFSRVVDGESFAEIDSYFAFGSTFLGGAHVAGGR